MDVGCKTVLFKASPWTVKTQLLEAPLWIKDPECKPTISTQVAGAKLGCGSAMTNKLNLALLNVDPSLSAGCHQAAKSNKHNSEHTMVIMDRYYILPVHNNLIG